MIEERVRFEVLLANVETSLKVLAEAHVAQVDHLHRIDGRLERLETKVDRLDVRVGVLETKFDRLETKVDKLETRFEVFASDTQQRLGRIETHLHMNGAHPRRSPLKATKRTKKH
jgi:predicted nuclease with TOPRIM domain